MTEDDLLVNIQSQLWRLENLYRIIDKKGKSIRFKLNNAQRSLYDLLATGKNKKVLVIKARQMGYSTLLGLIALDLILFRNNTNTAILADIHDNCIKLFKRIKYAFNQFSIEFPELLGDITVIHQNLTELSLSNNSTISAVTRLRSQTYSFVHISELAKLASDSVEKYQEVLTGGLPAVGDNQVVIETTFEQGKSSPMYPLLEKALNNNATASPESFKLLFVPFYQLDEYRAPSNSKIKLTEHTLNHFRISNVPVDYYQMVYWQQKYELLGEDIYDEYPTTTEDIVRTSTKGCIYEDELIELKNTRRFVPFNQEYNTPVHVALDIGFNDCTALTFFQVIHNQIYILDYYENRQEHINHYLQVIKKRYYDNLGFVILPHDARNLTVGATQSVEQQVTQEFKQVKVLNRTLDLWQDINEVRAKFPNITINASTCDRLLECLNNYKKKLNKVKGYYEDIIERGIFNHGADSFRYAILSVTGGLIHKDRVDISKLKNNIDRPSFNRPMIKNNI